MVGFALSVTYTDPFPSTVMSLQNECEPSTFIRIFLPFSSFPLPKQHCVDTLVQLPFFSGADQISLWHPLDDV
jgi:hypothetical protein